MTARSYRALVGGRSFEIELRDTDGATEVLVDGQPFQDLELLPPDAQGLRRLRLGSRELSLFVHLAGSQATIALDGVQLDVTIEDERTARLASLGGAVARSTGLQMVTAPMPGLVVRVNVGVGQAVQEGESLVVLQAMKMENELASPRAGLVKSVSVEAGQAVDQGQMLVELE